MDISSIEKVLIENNISYKIAIDCSGIKIKFGWFLGSFFVKYDNEKDTLIFGSKLRWIIYPFMIVLWGYLLTTLTGLGLILFGLSIGFTFIQSILRELKVLSIKRAISNDILIIE